MGSYASIAALFLLVQLVTCDPCALTSIDPISNQVFEIDRVLECFNSIPANKGWIDSTISSLLQLTELYSFIDINKASIPPWRIQVDLPQRLNALANNTYSGDYKFQQDLVALFNQMQDAQTRYYPPLPYRSCIAVKPFTLLPRTKGATENTPKVFLVQNPLALSHNFSWPFDPVTYYDYEVTRINGEEVETYLTKYSELFSVYKDPLVRFNALFTEQGWSAVNGWSSIKLDNLPSEVLTLKRDGQELTVTVPYRAYCPSINFNGTQQFLEKITAPVGSLIRSFIEQSAEQIKPLSRLGNQNKNGLTEFDQETKNKNEKKRFTEPSLSVLGALEDNSMFSLLFRDERGKTVPVLKIKSMQPRADLAGRWAEQLTNLSLMMQTSNWSDIIVDVSDNSGGNSFFCEAYILAAALVKNLAHGDINGTEVLFSLVSVKKSEFAALLFQNGTSEDFFGGFINTQTGLLESANEFYNSETIQVQFGPIASSRTKFTYYPGTCQEEIRAVLKNITYWPTNVMIVTNGLCTGSCAVFVSKMKQHGGNVKLVAHGGGLSLSAPKVRTASAPDRAYWWSQVTNTFNFTKPFITSADASFSLYQVHANTEKLPLEFQTSVFAPDHEIKFWEAIRYSNVSTTEEHKALTELYAQSVKLWPTYQHPVGHGPADQPTSENQPPIPVVTVPSGPATPAEGDNTAALVTLIIIGVCLAATAVLFFVVKYRTKENFMSIIKYRPSKKTNLEENLLPVGEYEQTDP